MSDAVRYGRDRGIQHDRLNLVTDAHQGRVGSRPYVPAVLETKLSASVDLYRCRASTAANIHRASPAASAVPVGSDDRVCVFGNAPCDYLDRSDPFAVPIVLAGRGAATGANDATSRSVHPDRRLH